jgi:hypothetical protein
MAIGARLQECGDFLMFVLTPADVRSCVWFTYPVLGWFRCPDIVTSYVDGSQLCRLLLEDGDRIQSLNCCVKKNKLMDSNLKVNSSPVILI